MSLKKQSGNMYPFVDFTWNPIRGRCQHNCKYCYMKKFNLKDIRLDESELKTNLSKYGNSFIFIGSGIDMFAENVLDEWIKRVFEICNKYPDNKYLFQTKNTRRFVHINTFDFPLHSVLGTTIETNRYYPDIWSNLTLLPESRSSFLSFMDFFPHMVTIEPIMDFDLDQMLNIIIRCHPQWVNIGADSKGHNLPEPMPEKIGELVMELRKFTEVKLKSNLKRLYQE